jgi:hypothetical protein
MECGQCCAQRENREKPTPRTTKALVDLAIYQGLQMVAGVGFEPTTFGL